MKSFRRFSASSIFAYVCVCIASNSLACARDSPRCYKFIHNEINEDSQINDKTLFNISKFLEHVSINDHGSNVIENVGDFFSRPYRGFFYQNKGEYSIARGVSFGDFDEGGALVLSKRDCIEAIEISYYDQLNSKMNYVVIIDGRYKRKGKLFFENIFSIDAEIGRHKWDVFWIPTRLR